MRIKTNGHNVAGMPLGSMVSQRPQMGGRGEKRAQWRSPARCLVSQGRQRTGVHGPPSQPDPEDGRPNPGAFPVQVRLSVEPVEVEHSAKYANPARNP